MKSQIYQIWSASGMNPIIINLSDGNNMAIFTKGEGYWDLYVQKLKNDGTIIGDNILTADGMTYDSIINII